MFTQFGQLTFQVNAGKKWIQWNQLLNCFQFHSDEREKKRQRNSRQIINGFQNANRMQSLNPRIASIATITEKGEQKKHFGRRTK